MKAERIEMPIVVPADIECPVHRRCIGSWLAVAAMLLSYEPTMRCICASYWCQRNQIELRAWHLYWAGNHDAGDEDRA